MPSTPPPLELTILMPCLNEAETLAMCIRKAFGYLERSGVAGEVLIADNGSTDGSQEIARSEGARVVDVYERGYGAALSGGIQAARGRYVIMGDADDSYDFTSLDPFVDQLRQGNDLVMGNRFAGGVEAGAMPALHKYIGNPLLSFVGRLFFKAPVRDFHCGLRGFNREAILGLGLRTTGMEFASEMVVKACLGGLRVVEVPTTLRPDGRSRPPHLRSFRDGWRHLRFLLLYSPRWLFLYPGALATLIGLLLTTTLVAGPITIGGLGFDIGTLLYSSALTTIGYQAVLFAVLSKAYARAEGFLPASPRFEALTRRVSLERGLGVSLILIVFGVVASIVSFVRWRSSGYGDLDPQQTVRTVVPAFLGLTLGVQTGLSSLFHSILGIRVHHEIPAAPIDAAADLSA